MLARVPFRNSFREPEGNLGVSRIDRVTSVANVAANFNAKVSTNGSHGTLARQGSTQHFPSFQDDILALPHHSNDGTGRHVADKAREKLLLLEILVMSFHVLLSWLSQLQSDQLVTLLLKALNDFTDEAALW